MEEKGQRVIRCNKLDCRVQNMQGLFFFSTSILIITLKKRRRRSWIYAKKKKKKDTIIHKNKGKQIINAVFFSNKWKRWIELHQ